MLERIFESPLGAIGLILFVLILGGIYLVNRERAQVQRLRGPRRFRPDWSRSKGPRRRRRRRGGREFRPAWSDRRGSSGSSRETSDTPDAPPDRDETTGSGDRTG